MEHPAKAVYLVSVGSLQLEIAATRILVARGVAPGQLLKAFWKFGFMQNGLAHL
jgi:hypothetical protein